MKHFINRSHNLTHAQGARNRGKEEKQKAPIASFLRAKELFLLSSDVLYDTISSADQGKKEDGNELF